MTRHVHIRINLLLLVGMFFPALVGAQTVELSEFENARRADTRLASENPAYLQYVPVSQLSMAEVYFSKNNGEFINYHESPDSYEVGVQTESFFRLNPKVVLHGKIHYANFNGKQMGGSVFIDPYIRSFDIQETTDATRGNKNREDYFLTGAASFRVSNRLSLGGRIDYRAANYAKFKDLRHVNKLFDFTGIIGAMYAFGDSFEWGINYFYRRDVEDVEFKMHGTTDERYISFIDLGAFYGSHEEFGSDGYTDPDYSSPAVGEWHGVSLQFTYKNNENRVFFNELSYRVQNGYYGKRSPSTPVFLEHRAPVIAYNGSFSFHQKNNRHVFSAGIEREKLTNHENIYRKENYEGGRREIVYLGQNPILSQSILKSSLAYTADLNVVDFCPRWIFKAEANYFSRQQKVSIYPYYRAYDIQVFDIMASAARNIEHGQNRYGLFAGVQHVFGGNFHKEDGVYATPSDTQRPPKDNDTFLSRELEYLTAARLEGNAGVSLTRAFSKNLTGYIRVDYSITNASAVKHLGGSTRHLVTCTAGCTF